MQYDSNRIRAFGICCNEQASLVAPVQPSFASSCNRETLNMESLKTDNEQPRAFVIHLYMFGADLYGRDTAQIPVGMRGSECFTNLCYCFCFI